MAVFGVTYPAMRPPGRLMAALLPQRYHPLHGFTYINCDKTGKWEDDKFRILVPRIYPDSNQNQHYE